MADPYIPLNQRGGTPLSKGRLPYTNQVPPTVAPKGAASSTNSKGSPMAEQAQVGDTVRLTITVEGEVYEGDSAEPYVDGWYVNRSNRTVEILSRATPPLPSEPGTWWLDRFDDLWHVNSRGDLRLVEDDSGYPESRAPFRQLVLK